MSTLQIQETDATGAPIQTYILTTTRSESTATVRLDAVPTPTGVPSDTKLSSKRASPTSSSYFSSISSAVLQYLSVLFLPIGYPHTVTPDYTPYQIYDSLQAFASSIAGLLSSRAVLQSLGIESSDSHSTATYATLLSIAQSTISNLSTILFANYASSRISGEVKFYRFLADIVNDVAFLLDLVSPSLPVVLRVPSLCLSSAFRAVCGVAGGSSKAVLSAHFAVDGNIGELNAKDGSQETVVGLVGMWVGGVVVSRVEGLWATWCWMVVLLVLHLWFNYLAVRSVRLRGLNLWRAGSVLNELIQSGRCGSVDEVGAKEGVFEKGSILRDSGGKTVAGGRLGVGLVELVKAMGGQRLVGSGSTVVENDGLQRLWQIFNAEQYLLWLVGSRRQVLVVFKENATREVQLKAWSHAMRASAEYEWQRQQDDHSQILEVLSRTLSVNNNTWPEFRSLILAAGWDVSASALEPTHGRRLKIS